MLIRTASDALALGSGQEHRTAEGGGTDDSSDTTDKEESAEEAEAERAERLVVKRTTATAKVAVGIRRCQVAAFGLALHAAASTAASAATPRTPRAGTA